MKCKLIKEDYASVGPQGPPKAGSQRTTTEKEKKKEGPSY